MLISIETDITFPTSGSVHDWIRISYGRFWKPRKHSLSAHHQNSFWIVEWHFCWGADDGTVLCSVVYWELIGGFNYK